MLGLLVSPLGRALQGLIGVVLLWIGVAQLTVTGLFIMIGGLIVAVVAAAPPAFLVPAPIRRSDPRQPRRG